MKNLIPYNTLILYFVGIPDTILTSLIIILSSLVKPDNLKRKQFIYNYLIKFWGRRLFYYTGSKIEVSGTFNIDFSKNYLVLVNHQSNYDIYVLSGFLNLPLCFLSKKQNFKIPLIGNVMKLMGCISINRSSRNQAMKSIAETAQRYEEGMSIIIYPEGTRSPTGDLQPFKTGFLHIIEKIGGPCNLLPISLSGTRMIQKKGKIKVNSQRVLMKVATPITVNPINLKKPQFKKNLIQQLENIIKENYQKNL